MGPDRPRLVAYRSSYTSPGERLAPVILKVVAILHLFWGERLPSQSGL